ncbi:hypothetical protein TWF281_000219 [Arthrobotrys megalospora]
MSHFINSIPEPQTAYHIFSNQTPNPQDYKDLGKLFDKNHYTIMNLDKLNKLQILDQSDSENLDDMLKKLPDNECRYIIRKLSPPVTAVHVESDDPTPPKLILFVWLPIGADEEEVNLFRDQNPFQKPSDPTDKGFKGFAEFEMRRIEDIQNFDKAWMEKVKKWKEDFKRSGVKYFRLEDFKKDSKDFFKTMPTHTWSPQNYY